MRPGPTSPDAAARLLAELLRRTHLSAPGDIARVAAEQARTIGAEELHLYLIDYEQGALVPLRDSPADERDAIAVTGTLAGRAYTTTTTVESARTEDGLRRAWLPLLDGTDRLGVMAVGFRAERIEPG